MSAFIEEVESSLNLGGNSFGRTYETLYPLTRMCPVYLSSSVGTLIPFVEAVDLLEDMTEANGVGSAKRDRYDLEERAGRLSARAAL